MRKLVIAVVAILAIFTFIREYDSGDSGGEIRKAQGPIEAIGID